MNGVEIKINFIPMGKMHVHFLPMSLDVRNETYPLLGSREEHISHDIPSQEYGQNTDSHRTSLHRHCSDTRGFIAIMCLTSEMNIIKIFLITPLIGCSSLLQDFYCQ